MGISMTYYATVGKTISEVLQEKEYGLTWVQAQKVEKLFMKFLFESMEYQKWKDKENILLIDDLELAKKIIRKELKKRKKEVKA